MEFRKLLEISKIDVWYPPGNQNQPVGTLDYITNFGLHNTLMLKYSLINNVLSNDESYTIREAYEMQKET